MSADLGIRRGAIADLDDAVRLFEAYLAFYDRHKGHARQFISARLERQDSVILLATLAGETCGFMQLYPSFASLSLAPSWILNDLYVDAGARGQGVAEALMQAAEALARSNGAAEIMLQTARDNAVAQRLYERLGYVRDDAFLVYTLAVCQP